MGQLAICQMKYLPSFLGFAFGPGQTKQNKEKKKDSAGKKKYQFAHRFGLLYPKSRWFCKEKGERKLSPRHLYLVSCILYLSPTRVRKTFWNLKHTL